MEERYARMAGPRDVVGPARPSPELQHARREPEVSVALHGLRMAAEELGKLAADLEDRLGPVLRPELKATGDRRPEACDGPACAVAREIVDLTTQFRARARIVADVIGRLEV